MGTKNWSRWIKQIHIIISPLSSLSHAIFASYYTLLRSYINFLFSRHFLRSCSFLSNSVFPKERVSICWKRKGRNSVKNEVFNSIHIQTESLVSSADPTAICFIRFKSTQQEMITHINKQCHH